MYMFIYIGGSFIGETNIESQHIDTNLLSAAMVNKPLKFRNIKGLLTSEAPTIVVTC